MIKIRKWFSDVYNLYLTFLTILITLPILAPIFLKLGLILPAKLIYFIYSFFCHQFAGRSIHIFDFQYAWCARDTAIWFGITLVAWLMKFNKIKPIKWYWSIPLIVPMALDGGLQTFFTLLSIQPMGYITGQPLYISNNFSRFSTGLIFGIGISLWISGMLINSIKEFKKENENEVIDLSKTVEPESNSKGYIQDSKIKSSKFKLNIPNQIYKIVGMLIIMTLVYFSLVQVWNITSTKNKPGDIADSIVRTPIQDFFERRGDAICPTTNVQDLFNLKCFLN